MRPFDTLIGLSENQLDEKRKHLAALEDTYAAALARRAAMDAELQQEQAVARESGEAGFLYGAYAQHLIQRRDLADAEVRETEDAVEAQREVVREAFAELRRYELAHEARLEEVRRKQEAKDQVELDEIAGNLLRRGDDRL